MRRRAPASRTLAVVLSREQVERLARHDAETGRSPASVVAAALERFLSR